MSSSTCKKRQRKRQSRRTGIAVVELAICLPLIVLIFFGTLETCRAIYLRQNLAIVAYEGARVGVLPGSSSAVVQQQCEMLLEDRGIDGYDVVTSPTPETLQVGGTFQVTVTAQCDKNTMIGSQLFAGKVLSETVVMRAE
ncbi:TadE family protein [Aporhodopirellula aestuarii]|uniref:Pilus assembly protein n=1 Tax=Aporhodopirellula aestuarii TaxID=2950107 RepID=A0ABT0U247_9BACT|nr:TadE family protein [Aporhodopirellula aestuarii]MCM2370963.1 pilus assembly protein [Aporhodopirellula aestuarii]